MTKLVLHIYISRCRFSIKTKRKNKLSLILDSLEMTMPALQADAKNTAKEFSIAPINSKGIRYNLIESSSIENKIWYSTVRVAIAEDMGASWQFGQTVF